MLFQGSDVATTQQVQELRKKAPKSTAEKDDDNDIALFGSDEYEEIDVFRGQAVFTPTISDIKWSYEITGAYSPTFWQGVLL
ncbi:hypothetical protein BIW11_12898 [Tropilaelaps mercedesae]|uniref:Uncharacterized protein n=1 Tax=Tropilaelaps mercedesae TaxID=418985 RepID=A0A1V9X5A5_9ACAR|nr:hypothetical protein BIW11_12898 [Tropilaelaps mercedesae]